MNPIQKSLLDLADTLDLGSETYYKLAKKIGVNHPYKVKFALDQLERKGYISRNRQTGSIRKIDEKAGIGKLISIPFYGEVNCGQALSFADDRVQSYLQVSPSVITHQNLSNVFALRAAGVSMNRADINGTSINDGDYLLAEKIQPDQIKNGDYVISVISGVANLKRFYRYDRQKRIILKSESTEDFLPIIISAQDADDISEYYPVARAIEIIPGV